MQACPHAESIRLSAGKSIILSGGSAESMIISALAESIILSALPPESMILSVPPTRKRALRVSARACPRDESIILSAGGAESMILLARAESIILSTGGAESMILSTCAESIILSALPAESMLLSVPLTRKHALRVSAQACQAESIIVSAGGAESMILSVCTESIILCVCVCKLGHRCAGPFPRRPFKAQGRAPSTPRCCS